jgi:hypothetical protein
MVSNVLKKKSKYLQFFLSNINVKNKNKRINDIVFIIAVQPPPKLRPEGKIVTRTPRLECEEFPLLTHTTQYIYLPSQRYENDTRRRRRRRRKRIEGDGVVRNKRIR